MGYISQISPDGGTTNYKTSDSLYGTCGTAAGTAQKTVTLSDFDDYTNATGVTIHVKFTYGNTASSPTLKIGSLTAKSIQANGSTSITWEDGATLSFTYDGTYWQLNDHQTVGIANLFKVITFSHTTPSISNSSGSTGWINITGVPDGYTAIGIVGVDSNHGYAWTTRSYKLDIANKKIAFTYTNTSSTNQTCTYTFYLLCVPSGSIG